MNYPIVQIKTPDNLWLHALHLHAPNSKTIFLNIHGTASNFYEEYFIEVLTEKLAYQGISMLSTNNRGTGVYDAWQGNGAAVEKFSDCLIDIDSWIEFALEQGYEKIIFSGHSLGTEKITYYMIRGKHAGKISALVLLAPATSPGSEPLLVQDYEKKLEHARTLVQEGKGKVFLDRNAYGGIMPKSAESYVDFSDLNPEFDDALPFHKKHLPSFAKIKIPILAVIGDQEEYTVIPITEALDLIRKENSNGKTVQISNCDHDFQKNEEKLSEVLIRFLSENNLCSH
jgi:pimeloyl-ACP methyl ester carboxylesterase